ncbi:Transcription initiation factor TFIID subunit 13 [Erysiphe necator]|uniref:Transcription initiation factor TFIID subunit 13 n=1 Tax=Uncinula necator TaxID=52586 RepID=A0A0B1PB41_UNCNE|nr:Transcription initiation factor TFIID subunit 13 [Erysiphe necator]KHJ35468.1 putative transcription initiation factor tfiid subunit 13 [Erysiphe necator]
MEPRARIGKNRGQQNFSDLELQQFLFGYGDDPQSLEPVKRILDELLTDFITELCFEAHRSAQVSGRQKIKLEDIKFACRKNPIYLGKIKEVQDKKAEIDAARKLLDQNDDKISKSDAKAFEEIPLGEADDDIDGDIGAQVNLGKSAGLGR